jgi:hypothetical protein
MAGVGRAPTVIVDPAEILPVNDIRAEKFKYKNLNFATVREWIDWLTRRNLIHNNYVCNACRIKMSLVKRTQTSDGFCCKCRLCGTAASIRTDSFFSRSNLALEQILTVVYGWSRDYSQKDIAHEANLRSGATHTIVDWCSFCREVCEQHLIDHPTVIGGLDENCQSKTVEIDESKFFHRKYHRGQWREGHWVFGGIERESGNCFLVEVPDRTRDTLTAIIERYICLLCC